MENTYVGKLVDVSQWDEPPELGIVLKEDGRFIPTMLTVYLFDENRVAKVHYTTEMVKFIED